MEENNKNNKLFIVAIVCVLLCIPIGIILGKTIFANKDVPSNNENVQNVDKKLPSNEVVNNTTVIDKVDNDSKTCTCDNYSTCVTDDNKVQFLVTCDIDSDKLSDVEMDILSYARDNIQVILNNSGNYNIKLRKTAYTYALDVLVNDKVIGTGYPKLYNNKYLVFNNSSYGSIFDTYSRTMSPVYTHIFDLKANEMIYETDSNNNIVINGNTYKSGSLGLSANNNRLSYTLNTLGERIVPCDGYSPDELEKEYKEKGYVEIDSNNKLKFIKESSTYVKDECKKALS